MAPPSSSGARQLAAHLVAVFRTHARSAALLLAAAALALQAWGFSDLRHDDAYITYRYGQNLADGAGLVFNPGERIMGSTSPGQALLAAALYALLGENALPAAMSLFGCLGWIAQALALWVLFRGVLGAWSAAAIALAVAAGVAGSWTYVALETNAVAALALLALCCARAERWTAAAALCALAGLFRADAHLLTLPLAAACAWRLRWAAWKPALVLVGLSLPWLAFAAAYYGSVLPRSALVKWQRTPLAEYAAHALTFPGQLLFDCGSAWAAILAWALALGGGAMLVRRASALWPLPAWAALHLLAYIEIRPFAAHTWHLYPLGLTVAVLALGGAASLVARTERPALRWAGGVALIALIAVYALRTKSAAASHPHEHWLGNRDRAYRRAAAFLRQQAAPGERVAAVEVGTLGYFSRLPMHDIGGLVSLRGRDIPPSVRWAVVDPHNPIRFGNRAPVALFRSGDFLVKVYDLGRRTRTLRVIPQSPKR